MVETRGNDAIRITLGSFFGFFTYRHIEPCVGLKSDSGRLGSVHLSNSFVRDILVDSELRKTVVGNIRLIVEIQSLIQDLANSVAKGHSSVVMLSSSVSSFNLLVVCGTAFCHC
jgi:hypothetical protein